MSSDMDITSKMCTAGTAGCHGQTRSSSSVYWRGTLYNKHNGRMSKFGIDYLKATGQYR